MKPDRIDFIRNPDGTITVQKLRREQGPKRSRHIPITTETKPVDFDFPAALDWCVNHGYSIRQWPGGARAWHGAIYRIRTAWQIKKKRAQLERAANEKMRLDPGTWHREECMLQLDLAYDG